MTENNQITFDEFYNDLMNKNNAYKYNNYVIEKITNLNLDKCNFLPHQKKFLEGLLLLKQVKYNKAFKCFHESNIMIENGYALERLGVCYNYGIGVKPDINKAITFFKLAVEKGNIPAMNILAFWYDDGIGIEKNIDKAFKLYEMSAEKGNINSLHTLAFSYKYGRYYKKDIIKAIKFYKILFEKGEERVMSNIICCYKDLSPNEKDNFCKSLPENSPILERIKDIERLEEKMRQEINKIDKTPLRRSERIRNKRRKLN